MHRPLFCEGDAGVGKTALASALAEVLGAAADPAAVLRGPRRRAGALRLGLPAPAAAPAGRRGGGGIDRRRPARAGALRPAVPGRPAAAAGAGDRQPRGAARRRGRPGRRRVRGVPARGAQRLHDLGARARHDPGRDAAGRRGDQQPHPRGARRAQAPLPLPLAASTRTSSARSRSSGAGCPRPPRRSPGRWPGSRRGAAARTCSSRPGVAESLDWTEALLALGARSLGPADLDRAAASLGAFVKYREDQERVARAARRVGGGRDDAAPVAGAGAADELTRHAGRLRPGAARRRASPAVAGPGARDGDGASATSTCAGADDVYWAGRLTLCAGPDDLARYDRAFDGVLRRPDRAAVRSGAAGRRCVRPVAVPGTERSRPRDGVDPRSLPAATASELEVLRHRDLAGLTAARARGGAPADRAARPGRRAAGVAAAPSRRTAARSTRGAPCARCCAAAASRSGWSAGRAGSGPAGWCCSSTSAARCSPTPTRCSGSPTPPPAGGPGTEVFTVGTRLTRVTREMRGRDPSAALVAVSGGGARLERRHPARRAAQGVPRPVGPAGRRPAVRSWWSPPTAGSAATPPCSATQMAAAAPAGAPGGLGQPAPRACPATRR